MIFTGTEEEIHELITLFPLTQAAAFIDAQTGTMMRSAIVDLTHDKQRYELIHMPSKKRREGIICAGRIGDGAH